MAISEMKSMMCTVAEVRVQSEPWSGKAHPPTTELFHNNSYAHDDQGDNLGKETEGSMVSSIN